MAMQRRYDAFLVRHWSLGDGMQRVEVIHVQAGTRTLVNSLAQAVDWIEAQKSAARDEQTEEQGGGRDPPGGAGWWRSPGVVGLGAR